MDGNRIVRLFILLLIAALAVGFCVVAFTDPAPSAQPAVEGPLQPKGKPRKLTPAEQRDSLNPKKRIAEG